MPNFGSRYPTNPASLWLQDKINWVEEIELAVHDEVVQNWGKSDIIAVTWQMVKQATRADPTLAILKRCLEEEKDLSDVRLLPKELTSFYRHFERARRCYPAG